MRKVPVVDKNNNPLMPCHPARARELLKKGRAIYFWRSGIFCIKLLDRSGGTVQPIVVGIDPGSKREGFSVKSQHHTYLNIQSKAVDWVKDKVELRKILRRGRRTRLAPYRMCRSNKLINKFRLPPSTRARWQAKLRILTILKSIFPISDVVVEDIAARTRKGAKQWNSSFTPLEVGKKWFYKQISNEFTLHLFRGHETKQLRDDLGLKKSSQKLADKFESHCVDSWVLANAIVGGHTKPDNTGLFLLNPLNRNRRALHDSVPSRNGYRQPRTSQSIWQKGALVKFREQLYLIGGIGVGNNSVSLTNMDGKVVQRSRVVSKLRLLDQFNKWGHAYA